MIYKWKNRRYPVSAQTAGEFISQVEKEEGVITPSFVVERSRDENSALHPCFEWRDSIAAEEYRKDQARSILRHLVVVTTEQEEGEPVRAFLSVEVKSAPEEKKQTAYLSTEVIMQDEEYRAYVMKQALGELISFKKKYAKLNELAGVFSAIEAVEEQMKITV